MPRAQKSWKPIVLVVEDSPLQRMDAVDLVEECGMVAEEAATADEALAILETRSDIAIVFTDVEMPGTMNGLQLVEIIRRRWPAMHMILTSGTFLGEDKNLPPQVKFYPKPYDHKETCATLQRMAACA